MSRTSKSHYIGCLIGGAIGDALGAPIEFMSSPEIQERYGDSGVKGYVEFRDGHGEFTDDTQMTLFTAEALLRAELRSHMRGIGGAYPQIAHCSYLRWLKTQGKETNHRLSGTEMVDSGWLINQKGLHIQRAPGNSCISALMSERSRSIDEPINNSKGCGGIMRVAPVGLMRYESPDIAFQWGCDSAAITHGHSTGYLSAGFFASMISAIVSGATLTESIETAKELLCAQEHHKEVLDAVKAAERAAQTGSFSVATLENLGEGWIAEEALGISLYCCLTHQDNLLSGVLSAVNHGGDGDSTGSIAGNILGLIHGVDAIPEKLANNLQLSDLVCEMAEDLYIRVKGDMDNPNEDWCKKYPGF